MPTARVPPLSEVDAALQEWKAGNASRYFLEVEESTSEHDRIVRLVVVDDQIRAAQKLEKDSQGNWSDPVALSRKRLRRILSMPCLAASARMHRQWTGAL
jgi:hypothetical protein